MKNFYNILNDCKNLISLISRSTAGLTYFSHLPGKQQLSQVRPLSRIYLKQTIQTRSADYFIQVNHFLRLSFVNFFFKNVQQFIFVKKQ